MAERIPAEADTSSGGVGAVRGITELLVADTEDSPKSFIDSTVNVYGIPFTKLVKRTE
jgi:hypothetical protein